VIVAGPPGPTDRPLASSVPKRSSRARCPRKHPVGRQQFLKAAAGAAGARVVPPQFLEKLFVAVYSLRTPLDAGFGRIALPPLTAGLESRGGRRSDLGVTWRTSWVVRSSRSSVGGAVSTRLRRPLQSGSETAGTSGAGRDNRPRYSRTPPTSRSSIVSRPFRPHLAAIQLPRALPWAEESRPVGPS
jgi:hypothetical protein